MIPSILCCRGPQIPASCAVRDCCVCSGHWNVVGVGEQFEFPPCLALRAPQLCSSMPSLPSWDRDPKVFLEAMRSRWQTLPAHTWSVPCCDLGRKLWPGPSRPGCHHSVSSSKCTQQLVDGRGPAALPPTHQDLPARWVLVTSCHPFRCRHALVSSQQSLPEPLYTGLAALSPEQACCGKSCVPLDWDKLQYASGEIKIIFQNELKT